MIMRKFISSTFIIILGWILLISAYLQKAQGIRGDFSNKSTGVILILGGILHKVRKHQKLGASKLLMIIEVPVIFLFLMFIFIGIGRGYWYEYPLDFCLIPLAIIISYVLLLIKKQH